MGTSLEPRKENQIAVSPEDRAKLDMKQHVYSLEKAIAKGLPKHLTAERMVRIAYTSIVKNKKLMQCSRASIADAIIQSSQLGLELDGVLGQAFLIPYGTEARFQIGYKGMLVLARRSGEIKEVEARSVYAKDHFKYSFGFDPQCIHIPSEEEDVGELRFVYAIVHLKDGGRQWDVWSAGKIDAHKKQYSKAWQNSPKSSPWETNWEGMAKKTVLIAALKYAPISSEFTEAIEKDRVIDIPMTLPDAPLTLESMRPRQIEADADLPDDRRAADPPAEEKSRPAGQTMSDEALDALNQLCEKKGFTRNRLWSMLDARYGTEQIEQLTPEQGADFTKYLNGLPD